MSKYKLRQGDNLELLKKMPDNSVDAIVTDGPYGITFMSKRWDYDVPSVELWKEVYRVLKPGGHVLSFGGTRTYHRMVVNIEDAGFEIRDQIMWLYGSGFPKSHNIGKSVDKIQGNEREVVGERLVLDMTGGNYKNTFDKTDKQFDITKGTSQYEGWGTALKPANEPICVARKPLSEKSVALNVLKWGTGGINVDGCRINFNGDKPKECELVDFRGNGDQMNLGASGKERKTIEDKNYIPNEEGRFPANIILDEIAGELLDEQSGYLKGDSLNRKPRKGGHREQYVGTDNNEVKNQVVVDKVFDSGGASRFFYQAKVSKKERNMGLDGFEDKILKSNQINVEKINGREVNNPKESIAKNIHPTVKPVSLMAYLCRLVTPQGGTILDPYMGSGSTGIAALLEGFNFIGMDLDEDYVKIAEARIKNYEKYREFLKK
jgi:DNA modification methylase